MADKLTIETCKTVKDYLDNFVPDGAFVQIKQPVGLCKEMQLQKKKQLVFESLVV